MAQYAGLFDNFENWQYDIEPACWDDLDMNKGDGYGMSLDCQLQFRMTIIQCQYMEDKLATTHSTCNLLRLKIKCVKDANSEAGVCADLLGKKSLFKSANDGELLAPSTNFLEEAVV